MLLTVQDKLEFINNCRFFEDEEHEDLKCWEWVGETNKHKEPIIRINGKKEKAIAVAFSIFKGYFNKKSRFEMICDKKLCVNPNHIDFIRVNKADVVDKIMNLLMSYEFQGLYA